ncbi:MAG: hypothetical protein GXO70_00615 [Acidobacteria bacterium]|nr:hypothetical protein [Acidobacteriota bacterium]
MRKIDGVYYKNDPKEDFYVSIAALVVCIASLLVFLYRLFYIVQKGTSAYFETNGMIAVMMLAPILYVIGYFPEMLSQWKSAYRKLKQHQNLFAREKECLIYLFLWVICMIVFFGVVDFSFLRMKGGVPRLGSVALLGMWGFFRNIYRLRKANWQERKRKREHEKHIEEIRSRRNSPSGKQK